MRKTFCLMAMAVTAAILFAGCEKESTGQRTESNPEEYTSKAGLQIASSANAGNHGESRFNYDNWRDQTTIDIYDKNKKEVDEINLPWAKVTSTSMPSEYKHPERELLPDGTPRWELAFNFCDWVSIPGTDMFGLWDSHAQIMRIYTYIEQLPNQNAKSCFYSIRSTAPNYIDPNTRGWMPTESSIEGKTWPSVISGNLPAPSQYTGEILPITGTLDGEVNPGWVCYEINFNSSLSKVNKDDNITFTLLGVEDIKFTATMDLQGKLTSEGGKITIPGNKTKMAGGIVSAIGGMFSGIASAVAGGAKVDGPAGAVVAGVGIFGAITSCVGGCLSASQDAKDKTYQLDINFNVSLEGEINGSLTTNLGTTVNAVQIDYDILFENILAHRTQNNNPNPNILTMGLWNIKNPPVIYVAEDAMFQTKVVDEYNNTSTVNYYPSFFDPSSIELVLNTDDYLYPVSEVDSIKLLAYDFVFTNSKYSMPAKPYYAFYGVAQDQFTIWNQEAWLYSCDMSAFKQNKDQEFVTQNVHREGARFSYTGPAELNTSFGMDVYDMIYSPLIHQISDNGSSSKYSLSQLGVGVAIEVKYKSGDKRIFADRFLPSIKSFKKKDAQDLKSRFANYSGKQTINGIPVENLLADYHKKRAGTVLDTLLLGYPARRLHDDEHHHNSDDFKYALCVVKPVQDTMGTAIVTYDKKNDYIGGDARELSDLEALHDKLAKKGDWSMINYRLNFMDMKPLSDWYWARDKHDNEVRYNIQDGKTPESPLTVDNKNTHHIRLYEYNEDGIKQY